MQSAVFRIKRYPLNAAEMTAITAPISCQLMTIRNGTQGDLEVHTNEDLSEYDVVASQFQREIPVKVNQPGINVAWLKAAQAGTVVIIWS